MLLTALLLIETNLQRRKNYETEKMSVCEGGMTPENFRSSHLKLSGKTLVHDYY